MFLVWYQKHMNKRKKWLLNATTEVDWNNPIFHFACRSMLRTVPCKVHLEEHQVPPFYSVLVSMLRLDPPFLSIKATHWKQLHAVIDILKHLSKSPFRRPFLNYLRQHLTLSSKKAGLKQVLIMAHESHGCLLGFVIWVFWPFESRYFML